MHIDTADVQIPKLLNKLLKQDPLFGKFIFSKSKLSELCNTLYKHKSVVRGVLIYEESKPEVNWKYIIHYKFQSPQVGKIIPEEATNYSYISTNKSN